MAKRQITSLQVLRGFAAFGVVCHHAFRAVTVHRPPDMALPPPLLLGNHALVEVGSCGVDIFFVLSGFLMIFISDAYRNGARPIGHFIAQRLIRIWPLYALATAVACLPLALSFARTGILPYDLHPLRLASFSFVPSFSEKGALQPIVGVGWTLNYEMLFYLCFALTLLVSRKLFIPVLVLMLLSLYFLGLTLPASSAAGVFFSNSVIFEFLFGAVVGELFMQKRLQCPYPLLWIVLGLLFMFLAASLPQNSGFRGWARGLPSATILIGVLHLEKKVKWPTLAVRLGDASYSIYLIHTQIIFHIAVFLFPVLHHYTTPIAPEATAAVAILASLLAGWLCYRFVESPLLNWCHVVYNRRSNTRLAHRHD